MKTNTILSWTFCKEAGAQTELPLYLQIIPKFLGGTFWEKPKVGHSPPPCHFLCQSSRVWGISIHSSWRGSKGVDTQPKGSQQPICLVCSLGDPWINLGCSPGMETGTGWSKPFHEWGQAWGLEGLIPPLLFKHRGTTTHVDGCVQTNTVRDPVSAQGEVKPSQRVTHDI